jgi:hypothetical protein
MPRARLRGVPAATPLRQQLGRARGRGGGARRPQLLH